MTATGRPAAAVRISSSRSRTCVCGTSMQPGTCSAACSPWLRTSRTRWSAMTDSRSSAYQSLSVPLSTFSPAMPAMLTGSLAEPYGSAKDPVNMAGMAGENVLNGTLKLWYADDLESVMADHLVLDVRSHGEHAAEHVPGCMLVPHTQVRDRLEEIRTAAAGRPVAVMCAAGVRSYLAHRILDQEGFDSSMLSGGMRTLMATLGDRAPEVLNQSGRTLTGGLLPAAGHGR